MSSIMNDTFIRLLFYSSFFLNEMSSIKSSQTSNQENHRPVNSSSMSTSFTSSSSSTDSNIHQLFNNSISANIINLIPSHFDADSIRVQNCNKLPGLTRDQRKICQRYKDHIPFIAKGTQAGIQECQSQFKNSRWNCSSSDNSFHHILKTG